MGAGTVAADDPRLTARPEGPRIATRIVVDRDATLTLDSQLVRTARDIPVKVFVGPNAAQERLEKLRSHGIEVLVCQSETRTGMVEELLDHCGANSMTNLLVEGGGRAAGCIPRLWANRRGSGFRFAQNSGRAIRDYAHRRNWSRRDEPVDGLGNPLNRTDW